MRFIKKEDGGALKMLLIRYTSLLPKPKQKHLWAIKNLKKSIVNARTVIAILVNARRISPWP